MYNSYRVCIHTISSYIHTIVVKRSGTVVMRLIAHAHIIEVGSKVKVKIIGV